jgi:hypothetical protein
VMRGCSDEAGRLHRQVTPFDSTVLYPWMQIMNVPSSKQSTFHRTLKRPPLSSFRAIDVDLDTSWQVYDDC